MEVRWAWRRVERRGGAAAERGEDVVGLPQRGVKEGNAVRGVDSGESTPRTHVKTAYSSARPYPLTAPPVRPATM